MPKKIDSDKKTPKTSSKKKLALVKKYATQPAEEMEKEQDAIAQEHVAQCRAMEQEISQFSTKTDELINPVTGKRMGIVKRPTTSQWRALVPPELYKYKDNPKEVPVELAYQYEELIYEIMAELIVEPKHDVAWWKANTGYEFVQAFQEHMMKTFNKMSEELGNF